jgi:hypothetical protein
MRVRIALAIAVVVVIVGALAIRHELAGGPHEKPIESVVAATSRVEKIRTAGQDAIVAVPRAKQNRRAVIYVHGAYENRWNVIANPSLKGVTTRLLNAGYVVAASDGDSRRDNWGNPTSVKANRALAELLRGRGYSVSVIAESMGGLDGIALARAGDIDAWIGIYPVCDIASMHYQDQYRDAIGKAWGDSLDAALRTHSPTVAPHVRGLPMLYLASPDDTKVPKAKNTDRCAVAQKAHGANVTVVPTTGDHGDPSNFQVSRFASFLEAAKTRHR